MIFTPESPATPRTNSAMSTTEAMLVPTTVILTGMKFSATSKSESSSRMTEEPKTKPFTVAPSTLSAARSVSSAPKSP